MNQPVALPPLGEIRTLQSKALNLFSERLFRENITLQGGIAPVRAYMPELMEDVLDGTLDPSPVFDKTVCLEEVFDGYAAMDNREAIKVLVEV